MLYLKLLPPVYHSLEYADVRKEIGVHSGLELVVWKNEYYHLVTFVVNGNPVASVQVNNWKELENHILKKTPSEFVQSLYGNLLGW